MSKFYSHNPIIDLHRDAAYAVPLFITISFVFYFISFSRKIDKDAAVLDLIELQWIICSALSIVLVAATVYLDDKVRNFDAIQVSASNQRVIIKSQAQALKNGLCRSPKTAIDKQGCIYIRLIAAGALAAPNGMASQHPESTQLYSFIQSYKNLLSRINNLSDEINFNKFLKKFKIIWIYFYSFAVSLRLQKPSLHISKKFCAAANSLNFGRQIKTLLISSISIWFLFISFFYILNFIDSTLKRWPPPYF